ncbi:MAG TPA: hypothetical protein PKE26_16110 [Kiritimatiellia bacterium]|nr:hypothetical protein [Kiritimatiellia bacterium]HMP00621.1 hypothetical protein [Kiritimatiellia bacterium]
MKVKINQLKTHLSRYVKELGQSGEPIEVCLREETVAYLTPAGSAHGPGQSGVDPQQRRAALESVGLRWRPTPPTAASFSPAPGLAGDGRSDVDSVSVIRSGRDW